MMATQTSQYSTDELLDNLVNKLYNRAVQVLPLDNNDLDASTLGKAGQVALQPGVGSKASFSRPAMRPPSLSSFRPSPRSTRASASLVESLASATILEPLKAPAGAYANLFVPLFV